MSQDYSLSKIPTGEVWKQTQIDPYASWQDREPLITPAQVRTRFLWGIPLYSAIKDPVTGKRAPFTDDMIKDEVQGAISDAELEVHIDIMPRKYREKQGFDRGHYNSFGYFIVDHRPAFSLDRLTVTTSNEIDVFTVPLEWVEVGRLVKGQINLIPMGVALNGTGDPNSNGVVSGQTAGGAAFLAILGSQYIIPSFWQIEYSSGFVDGVLPRSVNDLIGTIAAMRILGKLAATYARVTGASLGIDGLSQSTSGPGPQIFVQRLQELAEQRKVYRKALRSYFGTNIFSNNV